ncbi:hypothetical protein OG21DRAFT_372779 [Imleria badia]|nr:hypothetical protein OG21DRAFT_372779 [Imleria badia]
MLAMMQPLTLTRSRIRTTVSSSAPVLVQRADLTPLIETCEGCGCFYAKCCFHRESATAATSYSQMGAHSSVSGLGIAFGRFGGERTNQRAELFAAIHGLKNICEHNEKYLLGKMEENGVLGPDSLEIVITTDSEYVVKVMSEWLPRWQEIGFRKSNGERPPNLDLFLDLGSDNRGLSKPIWLQGRLLENREKLQLHC